MFDVEASVRKEERGKMGMAFAVLLFIASVTLLVVT